MIALIALTKRGWFRPKVGGGAIRRLPDAEVIITSYNHASYIAMLAE
jgi:hypothetical protein